ncbi:unnamed protein product, partial [Brenthis ino]
MPDSNYKSQTHVPDAVNEDVSLPSAPSINQFPTSASVEVGTNQDIAAEHQTYRCLFRNELVKRGVEISFFCHFMYVERTLNQIKSSLIYSLRLFNVRNWLLSFSLQH